MTMEILEKVVLKPYISDGLVDYEKLKQDSTLWDLLEAIEEMDLSNLSTKAKLAFWMNAYNLVVLKAVVKRLEKNPNWKGNLSLWDKIKFFFLERHRIAGRKMNLLTLENKIIRKFGDPRIHFAINCGSISCPRLPHDTFNEENLDDLLDFLTTEFINSSEVNYDGSTNTLYVSRIFKWYGKDFGGKQGIIQFISKYADRQIPDDAEVIFKDYDWTLNSINLGIEYGKHSQKA
ncbi:MAG: DUF547 domain-containing protein [Methanobacteriota archaeon]|nr:MAG: DUF547 domain-containing protein [Euryarchaeota archaeon]